MSQSIYGALHDLGGVQVLFVLVPQAVLGSRSECDRFAFEFATRFQRQIVLMAQDPQGQPYYFTAAPLHRHLRKLDLDSLAWQRIAYATRRRPAYWWLPIPAKRPPELSSALPPVPDLVAATRRTEVIEPAHTAQERPRRKS